MFRVHCAADSKRSSLLSEHPCVEPRRLRLPSVCHWQIVLGPTLSLPHCFFFFYAWGSVGQLAAIFLPLHHLFVARDVSGVQQLVDGRILCKEGETCPEYHLRLPIQSFVHTTVGYKHSLRAHISRQPSITCVLLIYSKIHICSESTFTYQMLFTLW